MSAPGPGGRPPFVAGNVYDKYRTRNPLYRSMMERFLGDARALVELARPRRVLEIGCGPGDLAARLFGADAPGGGQRPSYVGTDLSEEQVARARENCAGLSFRTASAYDLPFGDGSFDLVLACEVLEHLEEPDRALDEVRRVCDRHVLLSVPWEPVWRLMNLARGAYLLRIGDTPGHVQHFSRRRLRRLVGRRFDLVEERRPFPWTMLLARVRSAGGRSARLPEGGGAA